MTADTDKFVIEDISHIVLDADEKITIQRLANLHAKTVKECSILLDTWLTENTKKKKDLVVEYLVRGQLKNGNAFISVVPEGKIPALEKKSKNLHKSVYSVEVKSTSRSLELPFYEENKIFNLKTSTAEKRDIKAAAAPPKPEAKPTTSASTSTKTDHPSCCTKDKSFAAFANTKKEPEKKEEKKSLPTAKPNSISSMFAKNASPKKEKADVETSSTVAKEDPKAAKGAKAKPKPATKGTIAAFFSGKPAAASKPIEKKVPVKAKEEAPKPIESSKPTNTNLRSKDNKESPVTRKRTICDDESSGDDVIPATPTPKKTAAATKRKTKQKPLVRANKRSRIMTVESSSSSSEDEETKEERLASKSRRAGDEKPLKNGKRAVVSDDEDVQIVKTAETATENTENTPNSKHKAKRHVVKTYVDDEGYLVTKKELEEYSASEEEQAPAKVVLQPKEKIDIENAKKKTKQGSIMNFFTKKN